METNKHYLWMWTLLVITVFLFHPLSLANPSRTVRSSPPALGIIPQIEQGYRVYMDVAQKTYHGGVAGVAALASAAKLFTRNLGRSSTPTPPTRDPYYVSPEQLNAINQAARARRHARWIERQAALRDSRVAAGEQPMPWQFGSGEPGLSSAITTVRAAQKFMGPFKPKIRERQRHEALQTAASSAFAAPIHARHAFDKWRHLPSIKRTHQLQQITAPISTHLSLPKPAAGFGQIQEAGRNLWDVVNKTGYAARQFTAAGRQAGAALGGIGYDVAKMGQQAGSSLVGAGGQIGAGVITPARQVETAFQPMVQDIGRIQHGAQEFGHGLAQMQAPLTQFGEEVSRVGQAAAQIGTGVSQSARDAAAPAARFGQAVGSMPAGFSHLQWHPTGFLPDFPSFTD